jgi:hypothetical protein
MVGARFGIGWTFNLANPVLTAVGTGIQIGDPPAPSRRLPR